MIEERGVFVKWGDEECPSLGHLAGHGREREMGYFGGEDILWWKIFWKLEFWKIGKSCGCGGRKEIKEKEKKFI